MDKNAFIFIIGHGRSGTSLCTGLLNSCEGVNIGYEINNDNLAPPFKTELFPKDLNGNKIVIFPETSVERLLELIRMRESIISDKAKKIRFIFTERNSIDVLVSTKYRLMDKGRELSHEYLFYNYMNEALKIEFLRSLLGRFFLFDFDKAIESKGHVKEMFDYLGLEFEDSYYDNYKGIINYTHAIGIKRENVLFGRPGLKIEDRRIFENLIHQNFVNSISVKDLSK